MVDSLSTKVSDHELSFTGKMAYNKEVIRKDKGKKAQQGSNKEG